VTKTNETGVAWEPRKAQTPKFNSRKYLLNMALSDEQRGRKGMKNNLK
jgi:hypothetical protein